MRRRVISAPPSADAIAIAQLAGGAATTRELARRPLVPSVAASLCLHAVVLIGVGLAIRSGTTPARPPPVVEFEVGVVSESLPDSDRPTDVPSRTLREVDVVAADPAPRPAAALDPTASPRLDSLAMNRTPSAATPGAGRGGLIGTGVGGLDPGAGVGSAAAPGREIAGVHVAGERRERAGGAAGSLWGVGGGRQAGSIVYVLDRSGSMQDTFDLLQRELIRAIGSLHEDQRFNIIWFSEGPPEALSPDLIPASIVNKRRSFDAIRRVTPAGRTQPLAALQRGLELQPDVLYLLSDGDFEEQNQPVIDFLTGQTTMEMNTRIHTILFVHDSGESGERILRRIAELGGGTYKHVTEELIGG